MTREQTFLWVAELVMLVALGCFVRGFQVRRSDRALHMKLGKLGALLVVAGLVAVETMLRVVGWDFPIRSREMLHVHVAVASGALVVLLVLVVTGIRGPRSVHVRLWPIFFPLYVATIVFSLLAFDLW
jgi:hypothetical protein